jgi:hypothetical protein
MTTKTTTAAKTTHRQGIALDEEFLDLLETLAFLRMPIEDLFMGPQVEPDEMAEGPMGSLEQRGRMRRTYEDTLHTLRYVEARLHSIMDKLFSPD